MPRDTKEPQSYGSNEDWVTGRTGQNVHDPKSEPPAKHRDFYDNTRESEQSREHQGGHVSDFQQDENTEPPTGNTTGASTPTQKVTAAEGGAKRDSYFRKRDYE